MWCVTHSDGNDSVDICDDMREANAEHIVRCVNAHDELVEALTGIMAAFESGAFVRNIDRDNDPLWASRTMRQIMILANAQAALDKARE